MTPTNWQYPHQFQVQQPAQHPILIGRTINSISEVTPNDIPMDGRLGVFPLFDQSAIYTKRWCSDGTIKQVEYKPVLTEAERPSSFEQELLSRIEAIESQLKKEGYHAAESSRISTDDAPQAPSNYERPIKERDGQRSA